MTIAIGASAPGAARLADIQLASPAERRTDDANAAQNSATETLSQGIARHRSGLDRLIEQPSPLARFERAGAVARPDRTAPNGEARIVATIMVDTGRYRHNA